MINPKLKRCLISGLAGNALFIAFILLCLVYYAVLDGYNIVVEIFLYAVEISGFVLFIFSDILLYRTLQGKTLIKASMFIYTLAELVLMLLELGIWQPAFYDGMQKTFVIVHAVFSVFIMLTFLAVDSGNRSMEITVIASCVIIVLGVLGYRVYISMLFNAAAIIFAYGSMLFNVSHEKVSIFCKGDIVVSRKYKSSFFE